MKKIISLFQRDWNSDSRLVRDEITPGAEWVVAGEGVATRKWDGTACLVRNDILYKRYDAKTFTIGPDGARQEWNRKPPPDFIPAQDPDPATGHWPGWVRVSEGPEDRWHWEGWENSFVCDENGFVAAVLVDGTYELCGPKIGGNPEKLWPHTLIRHGVHVLADCPRDFEGIREYLHGLDIEGVVWWRDPNDINCDKVKIKGRDFGLSR